MCRLSFCHTTFPQKKILLQSKASMVNKKQHLLKQLRQICQDVDMEMNADNIRQILLHVTDGRCPASMLMNVDTGELLDKATVCQRGASFMEGEKLQNVGVFSRSMETQVARKMENEVFGSMKCVAGPRLQGDMQAWQDEFQKTASPVQHFRKRLAETLGPSLCGIHLFKWNGTPRWSMREIALAVCHYEPTKKGMRKAARVALGTVGAVALVGGAGVLGVRYGRRQDGSTKSRSPQTPSPRPPSQPPTSSPFSHSTSLLPSPSEPPTKFPFSRPLSLPSIPPPRTRTKVVISSEAEFENFLKDHVLDIADIITDKYDKSNPLSKKRGVIFKRKFHPDKCSDSEVDNVKELLMQLDSIEEIDIRIPRKTACENIFSTFSVLFSDPESATESTPYSATESTPYSATESTPYSGTDVKGQIYEDARALGLTMAESEFYALLDDILPPRALLSMTDFRVFVQSVRGYFHLISKYTYSGFDRETKQAFRIIVDVGGYDSSSFL